MKWSSLNRGIPLTYRLKTHLVCQSHEIRTVCLSHQQSRKRTCCPHMKKNFCQIFSQHKKKQLVLYVFKKAKTFLEFFGQDFIQNTSGKSSSRRKKMWNSQNVNNNNYDVKAKTDEHNTNFSCSRSGGLICAAAEVKTNKCVGGGQQAKPPTFNLQVGGAGIEEVVTWVCLQPQQRHNCLDLSLLLSVIVCFVWWLTCWIEFGDNLVLRPTWNLHQNNRMNTSLTAFSWMSVRTSCFALCGHVMRELTSLLRLLSKAAPPLRESSWHKE